jgi:hypothetical protein
MEKVIEHKREKWNMPFVSRNGEKVLTKNVNLSNVEIQEDIHF